MSYVLRSSVRAAFAILFLGHGVACEAGVIPSNQNPSLVLPDDRRCIADAECAIVEANCCGCQNTGTRTAVNTNRLDTVEARRVECGGDCPSTPSTDTTCCAAEVRCVDGVCELVGDATLIPPEC